VEKDGKRHTLSLCHFIVNNLLQFSRFYRDLINIHEWTHTTFIQYSSCTSHYSLTRHLFRPNTPRCCNCHEYTNVCIPNSCTRRVIPLQTYLTPATSESMQRTRLPTLQKCQIIWHNRDNNCHRYIHESKVHRRHTVQFVSSRSMQVSDLTTTILMQATTYESQHRRRRQRQSTTKRHYVRLRHYSLGIPPLYLDQTQHERPRRVPHSKIHSTSACRIHKLLGYSAIAGHRDRNWSNIWTNVRYRLIQFKEFINKR